MSRGRACSKWTVCPAPNRSSIRLITLLQVKSGSHSEPDSGVHEWGLWRESLPWWSRDNNKFNRRFHSSNVFGRSSGHEENRNIEYYQYQSQKPISKSFNKKTQLVNTMTKDHSAERNITIQIFQTTSWGVSNAAWLVISFVFEYNNKEDYVYR